MQEGFQNRVHKGQRKLQKRLQREIQRRVQRKVAEEGRGCGGLGGRSQSVFWNGC